MKPAARIGDMHMCPMVTPGTPPIPHVGGPIIGPGCPTVLICNMPAATMGDMCTCVGPPDTIILGSTGVFIGGKMAARMGDMCAHGGMITMGAPTVLIGELSPGGPGAPVLAGMMGMIGKGMNVLIELLTGDMDTLAAKVQAGAAGAIGGASKGLLGDVSAALAKGMQGMIQAAAHDHPAAATKAMEIALTTMAMNAAAASGGLYADPHGSPESKVGAPVGRPATTPTSGPYPGDTPGWPTDPNSTLGAPVNGPATTPSSGPYPGDTPGWPTDPNSKLGAPVDPEQ